MPPLNNPRHELFSQELAQGTPADKAYARAGYRKSRSNASTLRANQDILDRVLELQAGAGERAEVTIESLIREADQIQRLAVASGQFSAANAALISKAKLSALWVERTENQNINRNVDRLTDAELAAIVENGRGDGPAPKAVDVEEWQARHAPNSLARQLV